MTSASGLELLLEYLTKYFPVLLFIFVALGFGVEQSSVVITTQEGLEKRARTYDVRDLVRHPDGSSTSLAGVGDLIKKQVSDECEWSAFDEALVIKARDMDHLQIDRLLADLRRGRANNSTAQK